MSQQMRYHQFKRVIDTFGSVVDVASVHSGVSYRRCLLTQSFPAQKETNLSTNDLQDTSTPLAASVSPIEYKRAKLLYQSRKRGILENDLLFGAFAANFLPTMSENELMEYDTLLQQENEWELFGWVTGSCTPPEHLTSSVVLKKMQQFIRDHQRKKNVAEPFHIFARQPDLNPTTQ
jgi:succinate dehydrogenase assembly factor 2